MQSYPNQQEFLSDFDFRSAELIGAGTFGKVFKVKSLKSLPQGYYAIKMIETNSENAYEIAIQELNLYHIINYHQNVVKIYKVYSWIEQVPIKKYVLVLAMELAIGSMKQDIDKQKQLKQRFDDQLIIDAMNQCLKAFHYLAKEKCLFHRDIKPENLLITCRNPYTIKIADLGAGKENMSAQAMLNTLVGTPLFLSPKLNVAYNTNQPGKVNHNLEKSDVFSLGLTFLQFILLLSDRELMKLNESIVYDNNDDVIDCSEKPELLKECVGWKKLQGFINQIQNPTIKGCIYGMTHFSEKNRFSWKEALKSLNPEFMEEELKQNYPIKQIDVQQRAMKTYSNNEINIRYIGSINDLSLHRNILSANSQILSYSNDGIRLITTTGVTTQIYSQNVVFLTYLPQIEVAVGINKNYEIFAINLKTKQFINEKITNFASDRISVMKYMRKDMCILGNRMGEIFILAFDTQPPSVIKRYRDLDSNVIDLIYEDEFKQIISSHENKLIYSKSLVYQQSTSFMTDHIVTNLNLVNSEYFIGLEEGTSQIDIFHIYDFTITLVQKITNQKNIFPQSICVAKSYLVWVADHNMCAINLLEKIRENKGFDLLVSIVPLSSYLTYLPNEELVVTSDGQKCNLFTVGKKTDSDKTACKNCLIQ